MSKTHKMSGTTEYRIWRGMKHRCLAPSSQGYPGYGARGIKVCERWMKFEGFYADMGPRPPGLSLERKDNNGDYCKDNCYWATAKQQQRNTRKNNIIEWNGLRLCASEWAERIGIEHSVLRWRLKKWTVEAALTTPIQKSHQHFATKAAS